MDTPGDAPGPGFFVVATVAAALAVAVTRGVRGRAAYFFANLGVIVATGVATGIVYLCKTSTAGANSSAGEGQAHLHARPVRSRPFRLARIHRKKSGTHVRRRSPVDPNRVGSLSVLGGNRHHTKLAEQLDHVEVQAGLDIELILVAGDRHRAA